MNAPATLPINQLIDGKAKINLIVYANFIKKNPRSSATSSLPQFSNHFSFECHRHLRTQLKPANVHVEARREEKIFPITAHQYPKLNVKQFCDKPFVLFLCKWLCSLASVDMNLNWNSYLWSRSCRKLRYAIKQNVNTENFASCIFTYLIGFPFHVSRLLSCSHAHKFRHS